MSIVLHKKIANFWGTLLAQVLGSKKTEFKLKDDFLIFQIDLKKEQYQNNFINFS